MRSSNIVARGFSLDVDDKSPDRLNWAFEFGG
jgi:hypothetical protein